MMNVNTNREISNLKAKAGAHCCVDYSESKYERCTRCQIDALAGLSKLTETIESGLVAEEIMHYVHQIVSNMKVR